MEVPEELKPFFNDYEIHVFDIAYLSDEEVERFQSDFRIVADYFVQMRKDPDNYIPSQKEIKHVDEVLKLMKALTGDDSIEEILNQMEEGVERKNIRSTKIIYKNAVPFKGLHNGNCNYRWYMLL